MNESGRLGGFRGNNIDRLVHVLWFLTKWPGSTGRTVPCTHCRYPLGFEEVTADRIDPSDPYYARDNIQPSCFECNDARGDDPTWRYTGRRTRVTKVRSLARAKTHLASDRLPRKWHPVLARL